MTKMGGCIDDLYKTYSIFHAMQNPLGRLDANWWPSFASFTRAAFKKAHATPFVTSQSAPTQILGDRQAPCETALFCPLCKRVEVPMNQLF